VLLECAKVYGKLQKYIFCSTDEVYGEQSHHNNKASIETGKLEPTNPYAATKAAAEHLVNSYRISFKLPTIITRSNNIFGPRQYPEKLIPKFITLLSRNTICELHGDGSNKRSYLHVDDLCKAFDLILHKGQIGKTYNIGSEMEYKNSEVWKFLMEIFRNEHPQYLSYENDNHYIRYVRDRDFNDRRYWIDCTEIGKLGWSQQKTDFKEALKEVVNWYLQNSEHWDSLSTALEAHQVKK
jgi:dTDP-glucose 4,6-dehydratase